MYYVHYFKRLHFRMLKLNNNYIVNEVQRLARTSELMFLCGDIILTSFCNIE